MKKFIPPTALADDIKGNRSHIQPPPPSPIVLEREMLRTSLDINVGEPSVIGVSKIDGERKGLITIITVNEVK